MLLILRCKSRFILKMWGVKLGKKVKVGVSPIIMRQAEAEIELKDGVSLNGTAYENCVCSGNKMVLASLRPKAKIVIGKGTGISCSSIIATKGIFIGENVNIGAGCCIIDSDFHPIDLLERRDSTNWGLSKEIYIQNDVWLGAEVMVLKGVTIGQGAVVAARSLVMKDVPAFTMVAGSPAKIVKDKLNTDE